MAPPYVADTSAEPRPFLSVRALTEKRARTCERQKGRNPPFLVNADAVSVARTLSGLVQGTILVVVVPRPSPEPGTILS